MRKRRISYLGALGLALAVAIPGTASAAGTQNVDAGFLPEFNATIPQPPPSVDLGPDQSKAGTLYTRLYLTGFGSNPSSAGVFDIHAPEELEFNTKGLDQCDPADIRGQSDDMARQICADALIGQGSATAFLPPSSSLTGGTTLFNGTPQNGFPTVLFHSTAGTPITLVSEVQPSPFAGYGTLFHTLVARSAGGQVPDGTPIVDTSFTNSKKYKDQKQAKKAKKLKKKAKKASGSKKKKLLKKAKKAKKKSKKSWTTGSCGSDGELRTRVEVSYTDGSSQTAETAQACT